MAKKILVAEDDNPIRELLRESLTVLGYEVVEASNGADALEKMEQMTPDLIMLDIQMPILDGASVVRRLRDNDRFSSIPVIALTALTTERERALEAGFDDYLTKPATMAEIQRLVTELLAPE